jgi:phage tail sheath protein FI
VKLAHGAVAALVVKSNDGATTYVLGTDYTVDTLTGELTRVKGGGIAAGASVKASYDYADPTKVTAADIIGAVNAAGVRTGLKALKDTYNLFGFFAKILIAPAFCTQNSVAVELIAMADQLGAVTYIDAPIGTTYAQALVAARPAPSTSTPPATASAVLPAR